MRGNQGLKWEDRKIISTIFRESGTSIGDLKNGMIGFGLVVFFNKKIQSAMKIKMLREEQQINILYNL
jgi:hypothetical protein